MKKLFVFLLLASCAFAQRISPSVVNKVRYTDRFIWSQSPADDLSAPGAGKTINLTPCPVGIDATATSTKPYYVYIQTVGTPEAALVTGGTCTSNKSTGTIIVTTVNAHAAGYSVGTASSGIQEALNDASTPMSRVVITPSRGQGPAGNSWPIYAPVIFQNNQTTLEGDGASVNCFTRSRCIQIGSLANVLSFSGSTIRGLRFASSTASSSVAITNTACSANTATITVTSTAGFQNGDVVDVQYTGRADYWGGNVGANNGITVTDGTHFTFTKTGCSIPSEASGGWAALQNSAIEDNINGANMENLFFSTPGGITGKFNNMIVIDNDQAAKVIGMNIVSGVYCKDGSVAQYCGNAIYAPGPFVTNASVIYVDKANMSLGCNGNGINNLGGNTLSVTDSVIQGYSQFGINTGTLKGGFGPSTMTNVYQEIGTCSNFNYPGTGTQQRAQTGLMVWGGGFVSVRGGEAPLGQIPKFSTQGNNGTQYNYFIVVKDTTKGTSGMLPAGYATVDSGAPSGSITVSWPRVQGTATVTYDVLRTSGVGSNVVYPYIGGCTGGSTTACGSVATAQAQCATFLCSFTDTASNSTTSYSVTNQNYYPLLNFWPGAMTLSPSADVKTDTGVNVAYVEGTEFLTGTTPFVSSFGVSAPSIMASRCDIATQGVWVACLTGNSQGANQTVSATLFQNGPANSGGGTANLKGRLNILGNPNINIQTGHLITLVDSAPEKTLNSAFYRPTNDNLDTYLGLTQGSTQRTNAQLAMGAPVSIEHYIANKGDGTSFKEKLTSTLKTFTVPIQLNGSTSGSAQIGVAAVAGTPNKMNLPTATGAASSYLQSDGANPQQLSWTNTLTGTLFKTTTNCAASGTAANPSVVSCGAAPAGAVYCDVAASAGTCTVNTTAITATSRVFIELNSADGTELSKTCNAAPSVVPSMYYASKVAATSFTINMPTGVTNGFCFNYFIVN